MAEEHDTEQIIELFVLEHFIAQLPTGMAEWVQCHRPAYLDKALQLAENHWRQFLVQGSPFFLALALSLQLLSQFQIPGTKVLGHPKTPPETWCPAHCFFPPLLYL